MAKFEALLNNPHFVFGCQFALVGAFYYWSYKSDQAQSAKQKQKNDERNREFKERELQREQEMEQEMRQSRKDWKRKLKQDEAEIDRECREARYAFSKQFRENSQLIWANLRTCANMFEFERVFREWREQQQHEAMDSL